MDPHEPRSRHPILKSEIPMSADQDRPAQISPDRFRDQLDKAFRIQVGEQVLECTLVDVRDTAGDTVSDDRTTFSVCFRGPADAALPQQIYRVDNDAMGEQHLFLVTLGPDPRDEERRMLYEAVFT